MIGSRLRQRRVTKSVSVVTRSYSSGSYSDTTVYNLLSAAYEQQQSTDYSDEWGKSTQILDVFWFEPLSSGSLPAIEPKHFITEGSNRYEVIEVVDQGGQGHRLKVVCRRYSHPGDGI